MRYNYGSTLANSMRSWGVSGLLDVVKDRLAIISHPSPEDVRLCMCVYCLMLTYISILLRQTKSTAPTSFYPHSSIQLIDFICIFYS